MSASSIYIYNCFLYKWVEKSTGKWYIGSRTAKNCHPNDGYICSSKIVLKLITEEPSNWNRTILRMGDANFIRKLEARLLKFIDARNDPNSYNLHNGDGKFTTTNIPAWNKGLTKYNNESLRKVSEKLKGLPNKYKGVKLGPYNDGRGKKISESLKGLIPWNKGKKGLQKMSEEARRKMSQSLKGKPKSKEHLQKMKLPKSITMRQKLSKTKMGVPTPKLVCRLSDHKELDMGNYMKWIKSNSHNM